MHLRFRFPGIGVCLCLCLSLVLGSASLAQDSAEPTSAPNPQSTGKPPAKRSKRIAKEESETSEMLALRRQVRQLQDTVAALAQRLDAQDAARATAPVAPQKVPAALAPGTGDEEKAEAIAGAPPVPAAGPSSSGGGAAGGEMSAEERAQMEREFAGQLGTAPAKGLAGASTKDLAGAAESNQNVLKTKAAAKLPPNFFGGSTPPVTGYGPPGGGVSGGGGGGALKLVDVSVSLLNDLSGSTAHESDLRDLFNGDHDPKNNGFTAPNEEFVFGGVVDHVFRGDLVTVTKINEQGNTELEIEEAHMDTLGLGHGLQARAGLFFTDFGRINNSHPHTWDFATAPVINTRVFGTDGQRAPGARLSWLLPTNKYNKLLVAAQDPEGGGTMHSFYGGLNDGSGKDQYDSMGLHSAPTVALPQKNVLTDLVYTLRYETEREPSEELTIVPGVSVSTGPNFTGGGTRIYGLDLYVKHKPINNDHGFPFWAFTAEALWRSFGAYPSPIFTAPAGPTATPGETLNDWGFYAQAVHGWKRDWTFGLRLDYADGDGPHAADPFRDRRWRFTPNVTHYFSHFSKIRYELALDKAQHLGNSAETAIIQYEVDFGAHGAHTF